MIIGIVAGVVAILVAVIAIAIPKGDSRNASPQFDSAVSETLEEPVEEVFANDSDDSYREATVDYQGKPTVYSIGSDFILFNEGLGQYLGVNGDQLIAKDDIDESCWWIYEGTENEHWFVRNAEQPEYVLDIDNAIMEDGHEVKVWTETGYDVQSWGFYASNYTNDLYLLVSQNFENGTYCLGYDTSSGTFCIRPVEAVDIFCDWSIEYSDGYITAGIIGSQGVDGYTDDEAGYKAYLTDWISTNPAITDDIYAACLANIEIGSYTAIPMNLCFTDQWFGYAAMTYDEFLASDGEANIPEFDPDLSLDFIIDWGDDNLEVAMREVTGIYDREIWYSDVIDLTELSIGEKGVGDISALTYLSNLTYLELPGNNVSDISPLARLTNLRVLYIGDNGISDISALHNLKNLDSLDIGYNEISDISPLEYLPHLRLLSIRENNISDVSALSTIPSLEDIHMESNPIDGDSIIAIQQALPNAEIYY